MRRQQMPRLCRYCDWDMRYFVGESHACATSSMRAWFHGRNGDYSPRRMAE